MGQIRKDLLVPGYQLFSIRSFTLLELLIALSIILVIIVVVSLILKPQQILQNSRDTQRITELANLKRAFGIAVGENPLIVAGSSSVVYLSLPDNSSSCAGWTAQLPTLPPGWLYNCVPASTYKNGNGTGWLPINFSSITALNMDSLTVDPNNQPPYYYTYVTANSNQTGGNFELTAAMESQKNRGRGTLSGQDGGTNEFVYEIGDNLQLTPVTVEARATSTNP